MGRGHRSGLYCTVTPRALDVVLPTVALGVIGLLLAATFLL